MFVSRNVADAERDLVREKKKQGFSAAGLGPQLEFSSFYFLFSFLKMKRCSGADGEAGGLFM